MKIENLCINCMREMKSQTGVCEHCGFDERKYDFPQHHMRPFTILAGKYLIGKAIGEGGFGITYIGIDLELEARVAIKEYYPQGAAARDSRTNDGTVRSYSENTRTFFEEGREKFINEARTIAKFRELPEIVGVIEFFRENQTAYIVMEYLDGQTLKQYLKANGGKIPADELLRMMKPLISSLGKVHSQGLIHRDISPDNIMLMQDGSIKILDFGGARDFVSQNGKSLSVMVKHGYAPEEQYRSHGDQGPWTDVYALCATMYRCITGKIPPEALDRLYKDELKPISSFGVNCPRYVEQAISKGLSIRKDGRYQSMEELYDALYKRKPPKPPEPPKPKNNKTKLIIAAAAAAAIGIAVIAGVGIKMKQPDEKVTAKVVVTPTPSVKDEIKTTAIPTPTTRRKKIGNSDTEIVQTAIPTPGVTPTPESVPDIDSKKIALVGPSAGNAFFEIAVKAFKETAEAEGAVVDVIYPETATADAQTQILHNLISQQQPGAICISANDVNILQTELEEAMNSGIKVSSFGSAPNKESRQIFVNKAGTQAVGQVLMDAILDISGGEGQFAILTSHSVDQSANAWIDAMKSIMEGDDKYSKLELVEVAYGDDEPQKSTDQTAALLQNYPDLKVICAPTTVGIAAAAKYLQDNESACKLTGLGLPSEMQEYTGDDDAHSCPYFYLWDMEGLGKLSAYATMALVKGDITGVVGETFTAGDMGEYTITTADDGGTEIVLGEPLKFTPDNVAEYAKLY